MKKVFKDDIKVNTIIKVVCDYFGIHPTEAFKDGREGVNVKSRQLIHYLCKNNTKKSLDKIGKLSLMHGRKTQHDHSTILYSIRKAKEDLDTDTEYLNDFVQISNILKSEKNVLDNYSIQIMDKRVIKLHYEKELEYKSKEISDLKVQLINLNKTIQNKLIQSLLKEDEEVIDMFAETRVKPFLKMRESHVKQKQFVKISVK